MSSRTSLSTSCFEENIRERVRQQAARKDFWSRIFNLIGKVYDGIDFPGNKSEPSSGEPEAVASCKYSKISH